jgi:hypothetical protein
MEKYDEDGFSCQSGYTRQEMEVKHPCFAAAAPSNSQMEKYEEGNTSSC